MALYRFEAKVISRSGGRSTVNAAAYRTGKTATSAAAYRHSAAMTDERTGQTFDYTRKRGVAGSEILAPEDAPAWALDRQKLWNEVERIEKRQDAQLARDFVISLPHELDQQQRRALLTEFLQTHFVERGHLCDVAYHRPHGAGDDRNHHAHVMVPMRKLDETGFSRKKERPQGNPVAAWKAELAELREDWADTTNRHLEAAGRPERVSHLSLDAQGIDRAPEPKQGATATQMEREGRESHAGNDRRAVQAENAERAAIAAQLENVVSLAVEAMKRGNMDEPNEALLAQQQRREQEGLKQAEEQAQRVEAYRRQREAEIAEAQKREQENRKKQDEQARAGDISDAGTRYSIALAQAGGGNPYQLLANAALAEGAAFKKGQEELRKQAAAEKDGEKRREIELRRQIEAHEYMALTSQRLAGISATLAGREDSPIAKLDRERARAYQEQATKLREERAQHQAEREKRDKEQAADRSGSQRPNAERTDRQQEKSDRHQEMTESRAARLARLEERGQGIQREQTEQSRSRGSRGRG